MATDVSVLNLHLGKLISALDKIIQNKSSLSKEELPMFNHMLSVHKKPLNSNETKQIASAWTQRSKELHSASDLELSSAISTYASKMATFTKDEEHFDFYKSQCSDNPQLKALLSRAGSSSSRPAQQPSRPAQTDSPASPSRPAQSPRPTSPSRPAQSPRPASPSRPAYTTPPKKKRKWWLWILIIAAIIYLPKMCHFSLKTDSTPADISYITDQEVFRTDNYEEQLNVLDDAARSANRKEKKLIKAKKEEINASWYASIINELEKSFSGRESIAETAAKYNAIDGLQHIDNQIRKAESLAPNESATHEYREKFESLLNKYNITI